MIRPKTFKQIKFYLELSVKDKKIADIAYKTLTSQNASRATTSHNASRPEQNLPADGIASATFLDSPNQLRPMPPATRAAIFKKLAKKAVQEQAYNRRFETGSEDGLRTSTVYSRVRDQSLDSLENSIEIRKESHLRTKSSVMEYMTQNQYSKSKNKTEFNKDL